MAVPPELPQVYRASRNVASNPWLYFAGGVGLLAVALFGFMVALRSRPGLLQLHLGSTLPTIVAVGLFGTGYRQVRSPREVVLSAEGIRVRFSKVETLLPWTEIAWAEVQTQAVTNHKILAVYGNNGKVVLRIPSTLEPFELLVAELTRRFADEPSPHANALRWRKSRRGAIGLLVGTVLTAAGATWMAWMAYDTRRSAQLMQTQAVDGEATVVRKFVAPDGRTHRIEYHVAGAGDDAPLHNVEINQVLWSALKTGTRVPVKTVPGHPEIARLRVGQIDDESLSDSPGINLLLSIALCVMSIAFLVGAILGFKGMDIATDPATGKLRINRLPR